MGPNGAGKMTTLRMLTGPIDLDSGRARVAGCDIVEDRARLKTLIDRVKFGLSGRFQVAANELLLAVGEAPSLMVPHVRFGVALCKTEENERSNASHDKDLGPNPKGAEAHAFAFCSHRGPHE